MFCSVFKILEVLKIAENLRAFDSLRENEKFRLGVCFFGIDIDIDEEKIQEVYGLFVTEIHLQFDAISRFSAKNAKKSEKKIDLVQFVRRIALNLAQIGSFDFAKIGLDDAVWIVREHRIGSYKELIETKISKANGDLTIKYKNNQDNLEVLGEIWDELKRI